MTVQAPDTDRGDLPPAEPSPSSEPFSTPTALPGDAPLLGESPVWHAGEQCLYYCAIPERRLHRFDPSTGQTQSWNFDSEVACCAVAAGGGVVLALRSGVIRFDPSTGESTTIAAAPYDTAHERFNDGKVDRAGRFWLGTIHDSRQPVGSLYCLERGVLKRMAGEVANSNGLAFSLDDRTMYWADTTQHAVFALDFDVATGSIANKRVFAGFERRQEGAAIETYGGRPDGATVDAEGVYWVSCFEGQRLARFTPAGERLPDVPMPVRCPTMPCFGGDDLRTLYVTTSREKRPADELGEQPLAGRVLQMRVVVPGLPTNLYRD